VNSSFDARILLFDDSLSFILASGSVVGPRADFACPDDCTVPRTSTRRSFSSSLVTNGGLSSIGVTGGVRVLEAVAEALWFGFIALDIVVINGMLILKICKDGLKLA
jgi:hypothetical protein